ncbi:MAG: salicylate hydroxylase [Burkholderiales bacterium RIFCSPLOWO2_12_67_14]|jgi:salicylate 5-hydroxylase small subunit|uniref:aromatic-ring-hydroxylating dioxygenase subunit beta n=1 Tax=Hydrogenophaga taeniospiralis TaxID=65656 RepID=UPI0008BCC78F|nr:aromatic-ring-hydroxylating dioxygenase subunit beta [Hydrogenophaga taeniospiralis]OGB17029.1 MAG: salicylate hydroxylase [Burkholderiales bacterium RIFCSPLOWO2_02_FULL_67_64]OGB41955.1 MAG: salicylate hydroxylase [Burkholderiales bacterium RIFCSPHIGHO2_12_FULL_67_38]OGB48038.1 MAG: salicylate hydroxylase [Burkholderiales bacterium RIFCSPLOWO2_12_67_14]OGB84916.1 MAG: salicylate hydroxylase [Burkholderiales bacterium RIFCSPLOWO2_12_FULL_67_210]
MNMIDFKTYFELLNLYSDYAMVCDSADWEQWPEFFVEEGSYRLQPRENHEQGLPLCLLALESQAMIRDRVYGVKETMYHDPYYQRHIVGTPRVIRIEQTADGERIESEANYAVIRTKIDAESIVLSAGFYRDVIVRRPEGLKLLSRLCVYDSEMIANSIIYPI